MPSFYSEFKYCPVCSAELKYQMIEDKNRKSCPACDYIHWGEYSLGVGGVVLKGDKALLVQRANNPGKGKWTIPGGYVEQNERIAEAAVREVREETGILTRPVSILAIRDYPEDIPNIKHDIYITFLLEYLGGEVQHDPSEAMQAGFYSLDECRDFPIASLSLEVISCAINHTTTGKSPSGLIRREEIAILGTLSELFTLA